MTEQLSDGMAENQKPERKPLFDPYTGERLEPVAEPLFDPFTGERLSTANAHEADADKTGNTAVAKEVAVGPVKRTPRKLLIAAAALVVLALIGGGVWYVKVPMAEARTKEQAQQVQAAEKRRAAACRNQLKDPFDKLSSVDSRLDVGMVERDFTSAVGEAQAALDQVDEAMVTKDDCGAYDDLQAALQQYAKASTYWNNCIVDDYCTPDEGKLNGFWGKAGASLAAAKTGGLGQSSSDASTENG